MIARARVSLLWKILLSTSVAITLLFGITGWIVQRHAAASISSTLHEEVRASFRAYDSLWKSRARMLASVSRVLSSMSDVRAAFSTGDRATIQDTAGELWARISQLDAVFLVTDAQGRVIASLGGQPSQPIGGQLEFVVTARTRFPDQASGFVFITDRLYQVVVTPVYVQSGAEQVLLNVFVAGYLIDSQLAGQLKEATGGSEYLFQSRGRVLASSMGQAASEQVAALTRAGRVPDDYAPLGSELRDLKGAAVAELWILRSFESARQAIAKLRRDIVFIYLLALSGGLVLTGLLARRMVGPIKELDRAAAEVARQNYHHRVAVRGRDELGRLAETFNAMCESIETAREDLIRQERIATIGQLSTSIIHDLRNPLAAIYGGAEMLVDGELPKPQVKRLAANIYKASRHIQDMLRELSEISRGKTDRTELCRLREIVIAACDPLRALAEAARVEIGVDIPEDIEVPLARARMERVFANLLVNAIEAMQSGGRVEIAAERENRAVYVDITDTGPGLPAWVRSRLFQPFVSEGKKNGLGLGLALSRQTVLSHGGDLWLVPGSSRGAHFRMKLNAG
ncbi:MAG: HAMP domain-containing protein [Acidobacteria bacterium]|nr:HAMP domain-containing protein [Acidobacteriota bacterium]MBI3282362.1 HAMP domain-containing protein [Acidobacteriota bacterium]